MKIVNAMQFCTDIIRRMIKLKARYVIRHVVGENLKDYFYLMLDVCAVGNCVLMSLLYIMCIKYPDSIFHESGVMDIMDTQIVQGRLVIQL